MDRGQRLVLLVVVFVLLAIVGVPARATEKLVDSGFESLSGEISHAVAQSDELVQAVKDRSVQLGSGVEGLTTLWDTLAAIDVDGSYQDVDASALAALHGETSTAGGVAHAFALVANEMGFACAEEAGDDGRPMVDVTIGEEHFLLDVANGEAGARPWEARSSGPNEGASSEMVDLPEEEALAKAQTLDREEKEADESEPSEKSADKCSSTIGDTACAQANSDYLTAQSSAPSVVYGVHRQTYGDQANVKDGKVAGTTGESKRLEAIQVKILPKGSAAPGSTANSFRKPAERIIMVGDSRTVGAYWAVNNTSYINGSDIEVRDNSGTWWIARVGAGYKWFHDTGVGKVDAHVTSNCAVVIWLGINDITSRIWEEYQELNSDEATYAALINAKAKSWVGRGAQVYYATVGPLGYNASDGALREDGHVASNADVQNWNKTLTSQLSSDVQVLDAYGALVGNYSTLEGLHYTNTTSLRYYQFVRDSVL